MQISELKQDLIELGLGDNLNQAVLLYLCGTARKMHLNKMSVLVEGPSSCGKSYLVAEVLNLFPIGDKHNISTITQAGLMRFKDVEQKILYVLEKYPDKEVELIMREVHSDGKAVRIISSGKGIEKLHLNGPTTLFETTVASNKFDYQDLSRKYVIGINVSDEARNNILAVQRKQETLQGLMMCEAKEKIYKKHQEYQDKLRKHLRVIIPFAEQIRPPSKIGLRTQKRFMSLIKAIAFLHQFNREVKNAEHECIEANEEDFHLAKEILCNLHISEQEYELSQNSIMFGKTLLKYKDKLTQSENFTMRNLLDIFQEDFKTSKPIKARLDPLIDAGMINKMKRGSLYNSYEYRLSSSFVVMDQEDLGSNCYVGFSLS